MSDFSLGSIVDAIAGTNIGSTTFNLGNPLANGGAYGADFLGQLGGMSSDSGGVFGSSIGNQLSSAMGSLPGESNTSASSASDSSSSQTPQWVQQLFQSIPGMDAANAGSEAGSAASDTLSKLSFSRVATVLAGLLLVGFGLYYFGSSTLAGSITSAAKAMASKGVEVGA